MIQYLSAGSIARFGRLPERNELHPMSVRELRDGEPVYRRCRMPLTLGPGEGMALLRLFPPTGEPVDFYLDKPVELLSNVLFALFPMDGPCTVVWSSAQPPEPGDAPWPAPPPPIRSSIAVDRLYTVFDQEQPSGFFFPGERHRPYEFTYVTQGTLRTVVDGKTYTLTHGDAMVIPPDCWHMQYEDCNREVHFIVATFSCAGPLPEDLTLRVLPERRKTTDLTWELVQAAKRDAPYRNELLVASFQLLLAYYANFQREEAGALPQKRSSLRSEELLLGHAQEYIAEHTHTRLTVSRLAHQCGVSAAYLSVLFQRHLHTSPGAYILRTRLEESRQLIRSGAGSIAQVAVLLCFSSPQHFSTAFKRQYGLTPSAYARGVWPDGGRRTGQKNSSSQSTPDTLA